MNPIEFQKVIQGLESRIRELENGDNIPLHYHTGVDSAQIPYENIRDIQFYTITRKVTLTSAQILALNTTPVTLVPAQSATGASVGVKSSTLIIVEGIEARINYNSAAYTGANALEFRYTDASGAKVTADISNTFINSSATAYVHVAGVTTELTPVANSPIVVRVPTADPASGNSTITFLIKYRVVAFN